MGEFKGFRTVYLLINDEHYPYHDFAAYTKAEVEMYAILMGKTADKGYRIIEAGEEIEQGRNSLLRAVALFIFTS